LYADAAIDPPALASKTGRLKASPKPLGFALVEVPEKGLVFRDAFLARHRRRSIPRLTKTPLSMPTRHLVQSRSL
jgi:hypothetical protein